MHYFVLSLFSDVSGSRQENLSWRAGVVIVKCKISFSFNLEGINRSYDFTSYSTYILIY